MMKTTQRCGRCGRQSCGLLEELRGLEPAGSKHRRFNTRRTFLLQEAQESSSSRHRGGSSEQESSACLREETRHSTHARTHLSPRAYLPMLWLEMM